MDRILQKFNDAARERVNDAVKEAEEKTLAEILPVVSRASGSYDRAEDIVGVWTGAIAVGLVWFVFQGTTPGGGWAAEPSLSVGFWTLAGVFLVAFLCGVVLADRVDWLRRLFVPARELEREAIVRAKTVFFDRRVYRTSRGTGILLYVTLLERRVVVLADDTIADRLSERALSEVRDEIVDGLKAGDLAAGLVAGIERIGNLLGTSLPAEGDQIDEVPSEVVVID